MDPSVSRFLLAAAVAGRGPLPTRRLFEAFQDPEGILHASAAGLDAIPGLSPSLRKALIAADPRSVGLAGLRRLSRQGIRIVSYECPAYPERLRQIPDAPPVLFVRGRILPEDDRALAVVGSRRCGSYGTAVCEQLVAGLVAHGCCVVSGMARGIDTVAHWSALENGGRTVGVLGTGADVVYPRTNGRLFDRVPEHGFLVSEFPPGTGARPENFPRRNRIISGLAWGVLVVEAAERSGTMITVRQALDQGREIFAVPGDIRSPLSRGTHRLIQQGAKLVTCVEDILEEVPFLRGAAGAGTAPSPRGPATESAGGEGPGESGERAEEHRTLIQFLDDVGVGLDLLLRRTGWGPEKLSLRLTELELSGRLRRVPGNRYARCAGEERVGR